MIKFNEVTWYSKTLAVILFVIVIPILAFWIGMKYEEVRVIRNGTSSISLSNSQTSIAKTSCFQDGGYFVATQEGPDLGSSFLIKNKNENSENFPCIFNPTKGDFMFSGYNFLALKGKYLILDGGSGPSPRGISIIDLEQKTNVFTDNYYPRNDLQNEGVVITDTSIQYWGELVTQATSENCSTYQSIMETTGDPHFVQQVNIDFKTLHKIYSGSTQCVAFQ